MSWKASGERSGSGVGARWCLGDMGTHAQVIWTGTWVRSWRGGQLWVGKDPCSCSQEQMLRRAGARHRCLVRSHREGPAGLREDTWVVESLPLRGCTKAFGTLSGGGDSFPASRHQVRENPSCSFAVAVGSLPCSPSCSCPLCKGSAFVAALWGVTQPHPTAFLPISTSATHIAPMGTCSCTCSVLVSRASELDHRFRAGAWVEALYGVWPLSASARILKSEDSGP